MKLHILCGFIWIQIVCKGHQWSSKFTASRLRVKVYSFGQNTQFYEGENGKDIQIYLRATYNKNDQIAKTIFLHQTLWCDNSLVLSFQDDINERHTIRLCLEIKDIPWKMCRNFSLNLFPPIFLISSASHMTLKMKQSLTLSPPNLKMSFGTTFTFSILAFRK